ncbi:DUF2243 domain-containing protein [Chelatococcus sp. GCM10030263]|uniref:DUF2243 domain-containing protein n=1 Tax=Chelatococcus sp. GCM10030263 TaxID=3273387 RepID=UPI00361FFA7D
MAQGIGTRFDGSGYFLGFALGGFFDGILLHQILQWHHLLSAISGMDIRLQVAADGYFHAIMYVIAAIGLWLLWTALRSPGHRAGRRLFAAMLIGFGSWHVVDAVLSHWLLGIHRIRMDSGSPLAWDLLWLALFGIIPLLAGLLMRKGQGGGGTRRPVLRAVVPLLATLLVVGAGAQALQPVPGSDFTTVLFRPGTSPQTVFAAIAAADGQLVWADRSDELVVIRVGDGRSGWGLFRHGAILVSGAGLPSGCLNALRIDS